MKVSLLGFIFVTASSIAMSASAHHAFAAEFDGDKPFSLSGEITKVKLVNPHSWLYFDVKSDDGTVTNWGVELSTPVQLARLGLNKSDLSIGASIKVRGFLSRSGGPFGHSVQITLADGRTVETGGMQDVPALPSEQTK